MALSQGHWPSLQVQSADKAFGFEPKDHRFEESLVGPLFSTTILT